MGFNPVKVDSDFLLTAIDCIQSVVYDHTVRSDGPAGAVPRNRRGRSPDGASTMSRKHRKKRREMSEEEAQAYLWWFKEGGHEKQTWEQAKQEAARRGEVAPWLPKLPENDPGKVNT
jgi:hypothetical protein